MKNHLYRFAGFSFRHILGEQPKFCVVAELQHQVSGTLYHYHKDFPVGPMGSRRWFIVVFLAALEACKIADGKTVPGWELQDEPEQEPDA